MKFILLIALIFAITIASGKVFEAKKSLARSVAPEELALELEFYATCQEFKDRILPSIWISKHDLCLPIQFNVTENPDADDLRTHYFCTNLDKGRSIVHFVEIYESDETIPFPSFVVSLVPTNPFRVLTRRTTISRRPNCFITNDYCNATNAVVHACTSNPVVLKKNYIISHDRIYIVANQQESRDCRTSLTECCSYIAPLTFGGICENIASTDLLNFPKEAYEYKEKEDKKGKPGKPQGKPGKPGKPQGKPGKPGKPQHGGKQGNANVQNLGFEQGVANNDPVFNRPSGKQETQPIVQQIQQPIVQQVQQQAPQKPVETPKKSEEESEEENDEENENENK